MPWRPSVRSSTATSSSRGAACTCSRAPTRSTSTRIGAPASLQALVAARLDALTPEQRRVVNVASVLGTTLSRERIADLCADVAGRRRRCCGQLVHLQILERQSSRLSSDYGRYAFRQAVVRQVAYATLSLRDRKRIHLSVIRSHGPASEAPPDAAAVLAQHHLDAIDALPGDHDVPELRQAAVDLLVVAANRSRALGARRRDRPPPDGDRPGDATGFVGAPARHARPRAGRGHSLRGGHRRGGRGVAGLLAEGDEIAAASAAAKGATALSRLHRHEESLEIAWPLWIKHKDEPHATRVALDLSEALLTRFVRVDYPTKMRILDDQARPAEKLGDPVAVANVTLSLGLRYQDAGVYTVADTLIDCAARIAREHQPRSSSRSRWSTAALPRSGPMPSRPSRPGGRPS